MPEVPELKRNAAVLLGTGGTVEDVDVLTRALDDRADSGRPPSPDGTTDVA